MLTVPKEKMRIQKLIPSYSLTANECFWDWSCVSAVRLGSSPSDCKVTCPNLCLAWLCPVAGDSSQILHLKPSSTGL